MLRVVKTAGLFFIFLAVLACDLFEIPVYLGEPSAASDKEAGINLIADPGFETGISGFEAPYPENGNFIEQTDDPVIGGQYALLVHLSRYSYGGYTYNFPFDKPYYGEYLRLVCKIRILNTAPGMNLAIGPRFYYDEPTPEPVYREKLIPLNTAGQTVVVDLKLSMDPSRPLSRLLFYYKLEGDADLDFIVDDAFLYYKKK